MESTNKQRQNSKLNQTAVSLIIYQVKAWGDLKISNCFYGNCLFSQLFSYCFDKKGLGSLDLQEWLCKNPTCISLIKFFDIRRWSHSGHIRTLKDKKGLMCLFSGCMANLLRPALNIRCTYMAQKATIYWMLYLEWLQSQHCESSDCPQPQLQPSTLCMAA